MALALRVLTGALTGQTPAFTSALVSAGRHPESTLRFDAERDLDVSTRHAEFRWNGSTWTLRDVGSTNGTFVNGQRIDGTKSIAVGDVVVLGAHGPQIEVLAATVPDAPAPAATRVDASTAHRPRATEERIAVAVAAETSSLRRTIIAVAVLAVVGIGGLVFMNQRTNADTRAVMNALLARNDSLSATLQETLASAAGRESGLDSAMQSLRSERDRLSRSIRDGGDVSQLSAQMADLDRRTTGIVSAANADFRAINAANEAAVAIIYVESAEKQVFTGSGFGVSAGGLVVTNKHVVMGADGRAPLKIGVQFTGRQRPSLAQIVYVDSTFDLAIVQIENEDVYPVVSGITSSARVAPGDPVAVIGFPLGTDTPMERSGANVTARASLTKGTVSKSLHDVLQMDLYAAEGSSGSPVFDARGYVVGVVYGGARDSGGRLVYAVPSDQLIKVLPDAARRTVR
jgi:S1-C subfamily serine protease